MSDEQPDRAALACVGITRPSPVILDLATRVAAACAAQRTAGVPYDYADDQTRSRFVSAALAGLELPSGADAVRALLDAHEQLLDLSRDCSLTDAAESTFALLAEALVDAVMDPERAEPLLGH